jgi:hypothetical protein
MDRIRLGYWREANQHYARIFREADEQVSLKNTRRTWTKLNRTWDSWQRVRGIYESLLREIL